MDMEIIHEQVQKAIELLLDQLSKKERLEVFKLYCVDCGVKDPDCYCNWDD